QVAAGIDGLDEPFFSEFTELVFRFGHPVAKGDKDVSSIERYSLFFVSQVVEQAHHSASGIQPARGAVLAKDDGRQMPGIGVSKAAALIVVKTQEKRGIFFRLGALV